MALQSSKAQTRLVRFAASGLLALQAAITTTTIAEIITSTPGTNLTRAAQAQDSSTAAEGVYRKAAPAVVYVQTDRGTGSGVVVDSSGLIVTNAHVLEGAQKISVELHDGRKFAAAVVSAGSSKCLDLALLRIQGTNLPKLNLAASDSVQKGQRVFAIGYPKGIKPSSITQGIVSNVYGEAGMIQTDATLIPGNSGGALLNQRGDLLAINTSKGMGANVGMNFAVSADKVQALIQAYKQGISPIIGQFMVPANVQSRNPLAQSLSLNGKAVSGRFQQGNSFMCEDESYANLYTFQGQAYDPVMLELTNSNVGSYLMLLGPNGEVVAKGGVEGRNAIARIIEELPATGMYTVIANTAKPVPSSQYRLQATTPLLFKRDRLDQNTESCMTDESPCRSYVFSGKANQSIAVDLYQFDFDPYLMIVDMKGNVVTEGKAERQGSVKVSLPKDGSYRLIVSTVKPGDRGQFFLSINAVQAPTKPNQVSQNQ